MRRPCSRCSLWPLEAGPSKCLAAPPPSAVVCFGAWPHWCGPRTCLVHTLIWTTCVSLVACYGRNVVSRNFVNGDECQ